MDLADFLANKREKSNVLLFMQEIFFSHYYLLMLFGWKGTRMLKLYTAYAQHRVAVVQSVRARARDAQAHRQISIHRQKRQKAATRDGKFT